MIKTKLYDQSCFTEVKSKNVYSTKSQKLTSSGFDSSWRGPDGGVVAYYCKCFSVYALQSAAPGLCQDMQIRFYFVSVT